jgi:hypothetical protein
MKLLLLGVILSINISVSAGASDPSECKHCEKSLSGTPDKAVPGDLRKLAAHTKLTPEQNLGNQICMKYSKSTNLPVDITEVISKHIKKYRLGSGNDKSIVNFMNSNKNLLDCPDLDNDGVRRNIIKMAVHRDKVRPMIYKFLFKISKTSGVKVDFNAVDYVDGKFETPLDYIDDQIANANSKTYLKKLKQLRNIMANTFGAKNFNSLSPAIRSMYKDNTLYAKN